MTISVFELFSIGIGPSSSHTVGPMRAARDFMLNLQAKLSSIATVKTFLYGSLALTGRGHGTDKAILMGLEGEDPETIDPTSILVRMKQICEDKQIHLLSQRYIPFSIENHLIFKYAEKLDYHSNAMKFQAFDQNQTIIAEEIYYSIGGGFILKESERETLTKSIETKAEQAKAPLLRSTQTRKQFPLYSAETAVPYPFQTAADLLNYCQRENTTINEIMLANEKTRRSENEIKKGLLNIAAVMENCINQGCNASGTLPGGLQVRRRAPALFEKLKQHGKPGPQHPQVMSWLDIYAMAVNEENAAGGRVVTAPTNGAAGIIPAVLNYYKYFCPNANEEGVINFLLTAGAIGILYKQNASISGAEMGCQGEVGVACSMAAAGLTAALGGTVAQVENAAEIGMEHNLGLTCDPVGGLVQIPCIERNAMGTVKAVNAAQLALAEDGNHKVSLDMVIKTMREIGRNMNSIYKETSQGGLAVNVPEC